MRSAVQQVVKEEQAIFGELPAYDFGRYTFLANYLGAGHRATAWSTATRPRSRPRAAWRGAERPGNLRTVAHEFFHAWNVKRMRPKDLSPLTSSAPT
ncbi:MAG: hypothetical protein WKG07_33835 [Hymenobacter sp.]